MSEVKFRLAHPGEENQIKEFVNQYFDWKLPLINRPEWFDYYYVSPGRLHFAIAQQGEEWLSVAGYIPANQTSTPDVWVSVWVAKKGHNGVGLELMNALPQLLGARVVACNNIRPKTCAFYRFLGWTAERLPHYYRLAPRKEYALARVTDPVILPVSGDLSMTPVTEDKLEFLGLPATRHTPAKDLWYIKRRYFNFPHLNYQVWAVQDQGALLAYLVTRVVQSGEAGEIPVLRLVDYIGEDQVLPRLGKALDQLLAETGAEYLDCYNAGIPPEIWAQTGLTERLEEDTVVIPNYLTPPLYENTEYYYFTNLPQDFVMFKADGDQDRPNLS